MFSVFLIYMRRNVCVFGGCWSRTRLLVWTLARPWKTKAQLQIDAYRHRKKKSLKNSHNNWSANIFYLEAAAVGWELEKITVVTIKMKKNNNNNNNY